MNPSFEALEALGWKVMKVEEGHDQQVVFNAIQEAVASAKADQSQAVAVWVKTIKGYGIEKTEASASGGHGYPLSKPRRPAPIL